MFFFFFTGEENVQGPLSCLLDRAGICLDPYHIYFLFKNVGPEPSIFGPGPSQTLTVLL